MPTTINIFWLNTFIVATNRELFTGPHELLMNGFLLLAYSGWVYAAIAPKLQPLWLWDGRQAAYQPNAVVIVPQARTSADQRYALIACAVLTVLLFIGSTGLGYAEYRPIRPRDYWSYLGAWVWMAYMFWQDKTRSVTTNQSPVMGVSQQT